MAASLSITQLSKYILECIAFGGIFLVALYLMQRDGTFASALSIISLMRLQIVV